MLQKCHKELPDATIPFTDDDSQLATLWLEAGDSKMAAQVAKKVIDYDLQYLAYLNSLGTGNIHTYGRTLYYLVTSVVEATQALNGSGDPQADAYAKRVQQMSGTEAFAFGFDIYQQQMQ